MTINKFLNLIKHRAISSLALIISLAIFIVIVVLIIISFSKNIPNPKQLSSNDYPQSSQIFDRQGKLLYEFYSDRRRLPVGLDQVPNTLKNATIAIEDSNFYKHHGFDFRGILRGLFRSVFQGRLQGGSTLTQQLVKNSLLTPERTISRKLKEAFLTVITELVYSKKQILEMYLNQTPYGGTVWGVQAASKAFFNKDAKDLSLAESALIAGLPASPSRYSPFTHPEVAKKRQELVLQRMEEMKFITKEEKEIAQKEYLNYYISKNNILAPHFVFYVKELLVEKYGLEKVNEGGLKITTTIDLDLQNKVESIVQSELKNLTKSNVSNGAAIVTDPKTGEVLAMVGSKDYFATDIDGKYNVTTALRQPGSSIKPLNYAVALDLGKITAASIVDDNPSCFQYADLKPYCPTNYGNQYHGIQSIRNSLANSLNIAAVKTLKLNGLETFVASATAFGISTFNNASDYGLSLTLGGGEVKMIDMATAFGVFANGGVRRDLESILKIVDKNGEIIEQYQNQSGNRVLSRETSYIIFNILSDDRARSMVFGAGSKLNIKGHPEVAVKTGTTNDMRDNWTIGYSPQFVVAAWVGNNNNTKMGYLVSGTTGAAPIWHDIMAEILKDKPVKKPPVPANLVSLQVCNLTGQLPPAEGCESHFEYFKNEFKPSKSSTLKQNVLIDKDSGKIVSPEDGKPNTEMQEHQVVQDISGVWVCLDCPQNPNNEKTTTIIKQWPTGQNQN